MRIETAVMLSIFAFARDNPIEKEQTSLQILGGDLLHYIRTLHAANVETHIRIRSQPEPPGAYSKEVDAFLNRLEIGGYTQGGRFGRDAFLLLDSLLWRVLVSEGREEVLHAAEVLALTVRDYWGIIAPFKRAAEA